MTEGVNVDLGTTDARIKQLADRAMDDIETVYGMGEELGRGRFSVVQKANHKTESKFYAVKVVVNESLNDEENLEALETEIKILRQLNHPFIVSLKEVVTSPLNTYIVMELLSGGELFNRIVDKGCFSEAEAAELFAQILLSMEYLHSLQIVHRDVKPENILYVAEGSTEIKLIDFGYAGLWKPDHELTGLCGTPDYVAPEVLTWYDDDENGTPYGKGSDLWSLGVLLYVILSGCSPFSADEEEQLLKQVAEAKYEFYENEWKDKTDSCKDLIRKLLVVDPKQRMTMEGMLEHPWLREAVDKCRAQTQVKAAQRANSIAESKKAGGATAAPVVQTDAQSSDATKSGCSCILL